MASATLAGEEAAEDIATLSVQLSSLESDVSSLKSGLSSATSIGHASIVIAILVGAFAFFIYKRET